LIQIKPEDLQHHAANLFGIKTSSCRYRISVLCDARMSRQQRHPDRPASLQPTHYPTAPRLQHLLARDEGSS